MHPLFINFNLLSIKILKVWKQNLVEIGRYRCIFFAFNEIIIGLARETWDFMVLSVQKLVGTVVSDVGHFEISVVKSWDNVEVSIRHGI